MARDVPVTLVRPPRLPAALSRPRLAGVPGPGVLLLGPGGSGKTVLAAQWAAAAARSGWVRMAPGWTGADDLARLAAVSMGRDTPGDGLGVLDLAAHVVDLFDTPAILVVDDYQHAAADECDPLLAEVLALLPEGSAVVVSTRTRPPGLLGRAATGLVHVLGADELAFTAEEAAELFDRGGIAADDATRRWSQVHGWPAGLALGLAGASDAMGGVVRAALPDLSTPAGAVVQALAVLPYLTSDLAAGLGFDGAVLPALAAESPLVSEQGGHWMLAAAAVDTIAPHVPTEQARSWRATAAARLDNSDPETAIELRLGDGDYEGAARTLQRHLSEIRPDRAVPWLYRMPAEVRRRFPPALAAGRATVDLDAATALAEEAVLAAVDERSRREALYALGSAHLHAGRLGAAAAALEAAAAPGGLPSVARAAAGWLAVVRWWAGDLDGARAAVAAAGDEPLAAWAEAEILLAAGDVDGAASAAGRGLAAPDWAPACRAVLAKLRIPDPAARALAEEAYQEAVVGGGLALGASGPVLAWCLLAAGEPDAAAAVAETVQRRIGRHDAFSSLHVHLIRQAVARASGDRAGDEKAATRITAIRQLGFAPVESEARSHLPGQVGPAGSPLRVDLLGPVRVAVDGQVVAPASWKSQKAIEVLAYLAMRGDRGANREEAIEAVWPDREPEKGRMLLRAALSEIRRRLEPNRPAGEPSRFLEVRGERLVVTADVDARTVRALGASTPEEGWALFRGELLEEHPAAEWAGDERLALAALRSELAERVWRDAGVPYEQRVAVAEALLADEPWRDDLLTDLAELHRAAGNDAAARATERRLQAL